MTAIPVQRGHRSASVSVTDEAVEILRLRITHPETVAIARHELAERGPEALADTITAAVIVGMVATGLQRSTGDTTAAMQRVLTGFDEAVQARAAMTVTHLDGLVGQISATEQATREAAAAALAQLPAQIERGLTTALAGGAGNVREAVRQATATAQAEAVAALERVVTLHSEQVRAVVSTENPSSPIAALRRDLMATMENARRELSEGVATVRALVEAQQAGQAAAQKNSHTVGKDWEDTVAEAVASWSQASGDVVEHVGTRPAPGSSTRKSGDVLVRVMTGTRPVLIVEAKRRQKALTMRQYRDELAEARRIRRAHAALAIVPTPEGVPGPGRWARVDANSWVVAADDYGLVNLVLAVVRELAIVSAAGNDGNTAVNLGQAQVAIGHALDLLARFDDLTKQVSTAEGAFTKVRSTADNLRSALLSQLQEATRALRPGASTA